MSGKAWTRWNWIEFWLIPLIVTIMRVAWLAPMVQLLLNNVFVHPVGVVYPAWWLFILMLGATALERRLQSTRWGLAVAVALGLLAVPIGWGIVLGFDPQAPLAWLVAQLIALTDFSIGLPSGLIIMVITLLVWRRGLLSETIRYSSVWTSFVFGTLTLGALMLFRAEFLMDIPAMYLTTYMVTFVLSGLLSLALLSLTGTLSLEERRGSGVISIDQYWLLAIGSLVLATMLIGWLLGLAFAPETVLQVLRFFGPLWEAIAFLLVGFATLIAYLLLWLIAPLVEALYRRVMPVIREFDLDELREFLSQQVPGDNGAETLVNGIDWGAILRPLFVVALVAIAIWLFIRAWQRLRSSSDPDIVETRESILSASLIKEQLRDLFRRRRGISTPFLPLDPESSNRDAVRAYYQNLLASMQKAGLPRPKGATPYRFDEILAVHWPDEKALLDALTEEYVRARYAPDEPDAEQVERAMQLW
jgi:large-conductance mechanosensitive channel